VRGGSLSHHHHARRVPSLHWLEESQVRLPVYDQIRDGNGTEWIHDELDVLSFHVMRLFGGFRGVFLKNAAWTVGFFEFPF
jgi:hypothetical protein